MALLGVFLGAVIFFWSKRLFGWGGGIISLAFYCFCPNMLAYGPLVTADVAAALFFTLSIFLFWRLIHFFSPWNILASSFAVGGLFLSKFSCVLFPPVAGLMILFRLCQHVPFQVAIGSKTFPIRSSMKATGIVIVTLAIHIALAWGMIWGSYGFRYSASPKALNDSANFATPSGSARGQTGLLGKASALADTMRILPQAYLYGFVFTVAAAKDRYAFFMGEYDNRGWVAFFPFCFLVKTPLPFLLLLAAAVWALARHGLPLLEQGRSNSPPVGSGILRIVNLYYELIPLVCLVAVYGVFCLTSHINIGWRHLLPIYPALFIVCGAVVMLFSGEHALPSNHVEAGTAATDGEVLTYESTPHNLSTYRLCQILVVVCLLWHIAESSWIRPHYLAYFNQLIGGPKNGYHYLVDSSLDWGQDLPGLRDWLKTADPDGRTPVYLSYFGGVTPERYVNKTRMLPCFLERPTPVIIPKPLQPGLYCLSATMLQTCYATFRGPWTSEYESLYWQRTAELVPLWKAQSEGRDIATVIPAESRTAWRNIFTQYEDLRFARLCSYLRAKTPDAQIGFSICVYRLDLPELQSALGF